MAYFAKRNFSVFKELQFTIYLTKKSNLQVMKKIRLILILAITFCLNNVFAQKSNEEDAIKATINNLFDGMRASDSSMVRKAFAPTIIIQTIGKTKEGKFVVKTQDADGFVKSLGTLSKEKLDERIEFTKILVDNNLASVWTNYKFYFGDTFSHCGVNSFQLFKGEDGWKIIYIIDTRRKDNCN